jgi:ABC-type transport system involved in Fe-S cluster assembly fused permease/ATPase subunit
MVSIHETNEVLTETQRDGCVQWFFAAQILYKIATCLSKMSLGMMYLRIFPNRKFRTIVIAVMSITIAYTLAAVLLTVFACNPIDKAWNKALPGRCVDSRSIWYCK